MSNIDNHEFVADEDFKSVDDLKSLIICCKSLCNGDLNKFKKIVEEEFKKYFCNIDSPHWILFKLLSEGVDRWLDKPREGRYTTFLVLIFGTGKESGTQNMECIKI